MQRRSPAGAAPCSSAPWRAWRGGNRPPAPPAPPSPSAPTCSRGRQGRRGAGSRSSPPAPRSGFFMPFCMKNVAAACRSFDAAFSGSRKPAFSRSSPSFSLMKPLTISKKAMIGLPPSAPSLRPDEVERLHPVRALVDHRDPRVADELAGARLLDVAVPAEASAAPAPRSRSPCRSGSPSPPASAARSARPPPRRRPRWWRRSGRRPRAAKARPPSTKAFWSISARRTSGWTISGSAGPSGFAAPVTARPCSRSRA